VCECACVCVCVCVCACVCACGYNASESEQLGVCTLVSECEAGAHGKTWAATLSNHLHVNGRVRVTVLAQTVKLTDGVVKQRLEHGRRFSRPVAQPLEVGGQKSADLWSLARVVVRARQLQTCSYRLTALMIVDRFAVRNLRGANAGGRSSEVTYILHADEGWGGGGGGGCGMTTGLLWGAWTLRERGGGWLACTPSQWWR
jgi:hypothetical protein